MEVRQLKTVIKLHHRDGFDLLQVPLNDGKSHRFILTAPFVAVDGEMIDENTCRVFAETETGRKEILWEGEVLDSLEHMVAAFAGLIGLRKTRSVLFA